MKKMMKKKVLLLITLLLLLPAFGLFGSGKSDADTVSVSTESTDSSKKIISYIRTWPLGSTIEDQKNFHFWKADDIQGDKLTTLNIAFAHIKNGTDLYIADEVAGVDDSPHFTNLFEEIAKLQEKYPKLRINLCIGGWGAGGFSEMASSEKTRNEFVANVMTWVKNYKFKGIDIDWEYPVNGGWGVIKSSPQDKQNFTLLLKTLREKMDEYGKQAGIKMELSFAAAASPAYLTWIEPKNVAVIVDYVKVMCYDYYGGWSSTTGHHANLFANSAKPGDLNIDMVMKNYIKAGFPRQKLILGVPFYGRAWKGVGNKNNGLFQTYKESAYPDGITYPDIVAKLTEAEGFKRYWDDQAKAPFLYNGDIFVTFEDAQSLKEKMKYIKDQGLGGVMIWEYGHDMDTVLLDAINESLK